MRGLLTKLGSLDSSAGRGLRVVEFFDQLILHNADLEAVTRSTAVLAEVTAGAVLDDHSQACTVASNGVVLPTDGPSQAAAVQEVRVDGAIVGRVWLEHDSAGELHEWDELIIERMAIAVATLWARRQQSAPQLGLADPATLHVLVNDSASESETARAARLLGFHVGATVRVMAVAGDARIEENVARLRSSIAAACPGRVVAAALSSTLGAVVAATRHPLLDDPPPGMSVCVGPPRPVEECAGSWQAARKGVRFAALGGRWPRWTDTDDLGSLLVFADLDPAAVGALPDVQAIAALAAGRTGSSDITLLDTYGWFSSIREAAAALHMHHSSVNYRIEGISGALGYDIRTPQGRYRCRTALILWKLHLAR